MESKIYLEFSPYTYARVAVMRSKLLVREDYDKIIKLGFNEILKYIEETQYKKEVDEFDISSGEYAIIESALNTNLMRSCKKLYKICSPGLQEVLKEYLYRYDVENLKCIFRSMYLSQSISQIDEKKNSVADHSHVKSLFYESINYPQELFFKLLNKDSPQEVIDTFSSLRAKKIKATSLFEIENSLDRQWIERMLSVVERIQGDQQMLIKSFIKQELDYLNIQTILRLQNAGTTNIEKYLVKPSFRIRKLLQIKSLEDMAKELHRQGIITINDSVAKVNLAEELEIQLELAHLRKNKLLSHRDLLSPTYILSYFLKKDTEVRNLKILVKAKHLGLDQKFIENALVISS